MGRACTIGTVRPIDNGASVKGFDFGDDCVWSLDPVGFSGDDCIRGLHRDLREDYVSDGDMHGLGRDLREDYISDDYIRGLGRDLRDDCSSRSLGDGLGLGFSGDDRVWGTDSGT
jgi:hypothetical protein